MDDHKRNDQRADLAHWGQWTLDNGVINACNHELWVEPIEGAPTCPDVRRTEPEPSGCILEMPPGLT